MRKRMKIGDRVRVLKIAKRDSYYPFRKLLYGMTGTITRIKRTGTNNWFQLDLSDIENPNNPYILDSCVFYRVFVNLIERSK